MRQIRRGRTKHQIVCWRKRGCECTTKQKRHWTGEWIRRSVRPSNSLEPRESNGIFVPGRTPGRYAAPQRKNAGSPSDAGRAGFGEVGAERGEEAYDWVESQAPLPAVKAPPRTPRREHPAENVPQRTPRTERGTCGGTCGGTSQLPAVGRRRFSPSIRLLEKGGPRLQ